MKDVSSGTVQVSAWPPVSVEITDRSQGVVDVAGSTTTLRSRSVEGLRAAAVSVCRRVAGELGRPLRVQASEDGGRWSFAVTTDGITHALDESGVMDPTAEVEVFTGPCWACGEEELVDAEFCTHCGVRSPTLPGTDVVAEAIWLAFAEQDPVQVGARGVVLGRHPEPIGGRRPVAVHSPGREVSRTHALVDVDPGGWVLVTDHGSGNGIRIVHSGEVLTPGEVTAVPVGASLQLGDVVFTVGIRAVVAR